MADLGDFTAAVREKARGDGDVDTFEFFGERFALAERLGALPLMKYAAAAAAGLDSTDMAGLAAMHDLLRQCLAPEPFTVDDQVVAHGWVRFERVCLDQKVDAADIFTLVNRLITAMTGRPTKQPSDSSASPSSTSQPSKSDSAGPREATGATPSWDERMRAEGMVPVEEAALAIASSSS